MGWAQLDGVKVIGIGHKARQGKDTTADYLLRSLEGAKKYSLADDLKAYARVLGMTIKNGPILQALGTDVFRALDTDTWVRCLYWRLAEDRPRYAIIPDVRFPNEVDLVKSMGGSMIKVERMNEDQTPFVAQDRSWTHPSEVALDSYDGWDYLIKAKTGQLGLLADAVKFIAKDLYKA